MLAWTLGALEGVVPHLQDNGKLGRGMGGWRARSLFHNLRENDLGLEIEVIMRKKSLIQNNSLKAQNNQKTLWAHPRLEYDACHQNAPLPQVFMYILATPQPPPHPGQEPGAPGDGRAGRGRRRRRPGMTWLPPHSRTPVATHPLPLHPKKAPIPKLSLYTPFYIVLDGAIFSVTKPVATIGATSAGALGGGAGGGVRAARLRQRCRSVPRTRPRGPVGWPPHPNQQHPPPPRPEEECMHAPAGWLCRFTTEKKRRGKR